MSKYQLVKWFPEWYGFKFSRESNKVQPALLWSQGLGFWVLIRWEV